MVADPAIVAQAPVITDTVLIAALAIIGVFILYLMLRELRLMKTVNRKIELELEKDKLKLLQEHAESKKFPFTRSLSRTDRGDQDRGRRKYRS